MIARAQITRRADEDGVPARTVERDYVLAHIIAGLASLGHDTGLVFKGGTALRLCHFENYRYSADLDFSIVAGSKDDAYITLVEAFNTTGGTASDLRLTNHEPPKVAYVGPLGRERTLKLDLADDELVLNTEIRTLLPRWPDLPRNLTLSVYSLTEIAGEKLRCIIQRLQCRDLFDLSLILGEAQVNIMDVVDVFRSKAEHRSIDPDVFAARFKERIDQYRQRWETELREHLPGDVPHFGDVVRGVSRALRKGNLL